MLKKIFIALVVVSGMVSFTANAQYPSNFILEQEVDAAALQLTVTVKATRQSASGAYALGNSDFVIGYNPTNLKVSQGIVDTINNVMLRGRWDATKNPNLYLPMKMELGLDNYLVLHVNKIPISATAPQPDVNSAIVYTSNDTAAIVARFKLEIVNCNDTSGVNFHIFPQQKAIGAITEFSTNSQVNAASTFTYTRGFRLAPRIAAPAISAGTYPNSILFTFNNGNTVANADRAHFIGWYYYTPAGSTTEVRVQESFWINNAGSITSYRYRVPSSVRACGRFVFYTARGCDSVSTDSACASSFNCANLVLNRNQVNPQEGSDSLTICPTGQIFVSIGGGGNNYSFDGGNTYVSNSSQWVTPEKNPDGTGVIRVLATDYFNCETNMVPILVNFRKLTDLNTDVTITSSLQSQYCTGQLIRLQYNNIGDALVYNWGSNGQGTFVDSSGNPAPLNASVIYYKPSPLDANTTVSFNVRNECFDIADTTAPTFFIPSLNPEFTSSRNPANTAIVGREVVYTLVDPQPNNGTYLWTFSDGTPAQQGPDPKPHTFKEDGVYTVTVTGYNNNGCVDTYTLTVTAQTLQTLYVPTIFSPASRELENQTFRIYGANISENGFKLAIYNTWGQEVYNTSSFRTANTVGWAGVKNGSGDIVSGVYTYTLRGQYNNGTSFEKSGTVTLIK